MNKLLSSAISRLSGCLSDDFMTFGGALKAAAFVLVSSLLVACGDSGYPSPDSFQLESDAATDRVTGILVKTYFSSKANVHAGYFNAPLFRANGGFYFLSDDAVGVNLYCFDGAESVRVTEFSGVDVWAGANTVGLSAVQSNDDIFISDGTTVYRGSNRDCQPLSSAYSAAAGESLWAPLHVTRDGRYLSVTMTRKEEPGVNYVCRVRLPDGLRKCLRSPLLGTDKPYVDHAQINPFHPDQMLFAHDASWVKDRIWLWPVEAAVASPFWIQPELTEIGHEFWANDDSGLVYAVQYGQPAYNIPSGLLRIAPSGQADLMGSNREYYLAHASLSPDFKYFVADTYRPDAQGRYWLVLFDVLANKYTKITEVPSGQHPAHGHPSWSTSGEEIIFTAMKDGRLVLKVVKLPDILTKQPGG